MNNAIPMNLTSRWKTTRPILVTPNDKRFPKFSKQLEKHGFCDAETWSLDTVIAEFILPRLIRFKQVTIGHPGQLSMDEWNVILDKMIFSFQFSMQQETWPTESFEADYARYKEGIKLFSDWYGHLWW